MPERPVAPAVGHDPIAALREPATIRLRCASILAAVDAGRSAHFTLDRSKLDAVAQRVAALTRRRFPDLKTPYHSRWRHFEAGGVDRKAAMDARLAGRDAADVARARIDLTMVSVLLDAGAGPAWRFHETADGNRPAGVYARSEGLGVASFHGFAAGLFSSSGDPLRADAPALQRLQPEALRTLFQADAANPMVGLDGRTALLQRLGQQLAELASAQGGEARPGRLFDRLTDDGRGVRRAEVSAADLLRALVTDFAPIWTSGSRVHGVPAGDVWPHPFAGAATAQGDDTATAGWVPFHKLSQWLAYSLLEPFEWAGVTVTGLDALTGLPEYRNGGLLIDGGVLVPRDAALTTRPWKPSEEAIVEWRALTVALLDELAQRVRVQLGVTAEALPLACILEGGSWAAGREIAAELRDGSPPVTIDSDGTVF